MTEASVTHTPAPETLARGTESPMAKTRRRTTSWTAFVGASRMWALAAICLIVAATLVITSLKKTGTEITISFPEGHGLKHGDRVRYRGIEVGEVEKVALAANMRGIDVTVLLAPEAENLAREGTRFWIVRPEISLTSVKGLDTAVSGKFIAVSPGDPNASFQTGFAGLSQAPADEWAERGLSIVLRSEESHGLAPGAPVLWRGLKVGQVLSVDLAFDTRFVDIHAKIDQKYVPLVRENSKFWVNKGLGIDAGLTGFKFEAESLETIARGGISFTTPRTEREFNAPSSGQVFTLYAEAQKKWLELKETASLVNVQVPPMTVLRFVWKEKSLGFARTKERRVCGAVHSVARHRIEVICPADLLDSQDRALPDTWSVTIVDPSQNGRIEIASDLGVVATSTNGLALLRLNIEEGAVTITSAVPTFRNPATPEDCCVVRSVRSDEGASVLIHPLSSNQIRTEGNTWNVIEFSGNGVDWHGAPVVSSEDSAVIGVILATDTGIEVAPLSETISG